MIFGCFPFYTDYILELRCTILLYVIISHSQVIVPSCMCSIVVLLFDGDDYVHDICVRYDSLWSIKVHVYTCIHIYLYIYICNT